MNRICFFFCCLCFGVGCKKNSSTAPSGGNQNNITPQLFEYTITPSSINQNTIAFNNPHEVFIDTRTSLKNKLFIFLPGTTGTPYFYRQILKKAASLGYHVIGLMYPNNSDLYTTAATSNNLDEFENARKEIFDGSNQTNGVSVDSNNCIKSRLAQLLQYLQTLHPEQGWNNFLVQKDINWANCIVAGHSQGGGHAFYIAKQKAVYRAVSFSSIDWNTSLNQSANWISKSGATQVDRFFSFNAIKDQIFNYANVQTQLLEMNLQGPAVSIDNNNPPYLNSHIITTNATPGLAVLFPDHNITCLDSYVPTDTKGNVIASFDRAWEYLLTL